MKRLALGISVFLAILAVPMIQGCNSEDAGGASGPVAGAPGGGGGDRVRACASSLALGDWLKLDGTDTMSFGDDCTFRSSACGSLGQVASVDAASGTMHLTVGSTDTLDGCLPAGEYDCAYSIYDSGADKLADIACAGGATVTYKRQ